MSDEFNRYIDEANLNINSNPIALRNSWLLPVSDRDALKDTSVELQELSEKLSTIIDEIQTEINGMKEYVYTGSSDNWEATITMTKYEHFVKDKEWNVIDYDNYLGKFGEIVYIGQNEDDIGTVEYSYIFKSFSSDGGKSTLNDNIVHLPSGNMMGGGVPGDYGFYKMNIEWDGNEETIILNATLK